MKIDGYQVQWGCWGKDISYLDMKRETFGSLKDAVFKAEASWLGGLCEIVKITDWRPLSASQNPEILWLRQRSSRCKWEILFDNGSEKFLSPQFSPSQKSHFGFRVVADQFRVVEPGYMPSEGTLSGEDSLRSVLAKIWETAWQPSRLFNLSSEIYFVGFDIKDRCADFILSEGLK